MYLSTLAHIHLFDLFNVHPTGTMPFAGLLAVELNHLLLLHWIQVFRRIAISTGTRLHLVRCMAWYHRYHFTTVKTQSRRNLMFCFFSEFLLVLIDLVVSNVIIRPRKSGPVQCKHTDGLLIPCLLMGHGPQESRRPRK